MPFSVSQLSKSDTAIYKMDVKTLRGVAGAF